MAWHLCMRIGTLPWIWMKSLTFNVAPLSATKENYTVTVCFINTIRHNFTKERKTETLFYPEQRILLHTLQCELFDWLLLILTLLPAY